jgi:hypothetical protein
MVEIGLIGKLTLSFLIPLHCVQRRISNIYIYIYIIYIY